MEQNRKFSFFRITKFEIKFSRLPVNNQLADSTITESKHHSTKAFKIYSPTDTPLGNCAQDGSTAKWKAILDFDMKWIIIFEDIKTYPHINNALSRHTLILIMPFQVCDPELFIYDCDPCSSLRSRKKQLYRLTIYVQKCVLTTDRKQERKRIDGW
jgi:hypothetical protein